MVELRGFTAEILYLTMICRGLLSLRVSAVPPGHTCVTYVCPAKLARSLCPDLAACHTTECHLQMSLLIKALFLRWALAYRTWAKLYLPMLFISFFELDVRECLLATCSNNNFHSPSYSGSYGSQARSLASILHSWSILHIPHCIGYISNIL